MNKKETYFYYNPLWLEKILSDHKLKTFQFAHQAGIDKATMGLLMKDRYRTKAKTSVFDRIEAALTQLGVADIANFYNTPEKITFKEDKPEETNDFVLNHFQFKRDPFCLIIDPTDTYQSQEFCNLLKQINNVVYQHKFLAIIGSVGAGKSTLYRTAFKMLRDDPAVRVSNVPMIHAKHLSDKYLTEIIIEELGQQKIPVGLRRKAQALNHTLSDLAMKNIKPALLFDEAQNINDDTMKDIRLLWEEWNQFNNPIAFVLFAKPDFLIRLQKGSMLEVARRVDIMRIHNFHEASRSDVQGYITHRITKAGGNPNIFSANAIAYIADRAKTFLDVNILARAGMISAARVQDETIYPDHIKAGLQG